MPHAYTEAKLFEQPTIGLCAEQVALPHPHPRPFSQREKGGRQAGLWVRSLVVLVSRLRAALERLNPAPPPEAITAASISPKTPVSPRSEFTVFSETPGAKGGLGLFVWLTAGRCKSFICSRFLFE